MSGDARISIHRRGQAAVGVVTWLIATTVAVVAVGCGALAGAGVSRRRFSQIPGAFRCKLRLSTDPAARRRWPRRVTYAVWSHDVLVVSRGILVARTRPFPVRFAETSQEPADPREVRGLGRRPVQMALLLDGGALATLAAAAEASEPLAGPFVAAQVPLPDTR